MPRNLCRHISLSIIVSSLILLPAMAHADLNKGLLAGWNHSDWDYNWPYDEDSLHPKNGMCFGVYLGAEVSGLLGWRTEVLYTQKGAKTQSQAMDEEGVALGEINTYYNVDYLEIPLLFSMTIPTGGAVRPVFLAGPAIGFELSATKKTEYPSGIDFPFNDDGDFDTDFGTDFSWIIAGGVDIDAGGKVINLQVRYIMGQKKVYAQSTNTTLSVMAGFGI